MTPTKMLSNEVFDLPLFHIPQTAWETLACISYHEGIPLKPGDIVSIEGHHDDIRYIGRVESLSTIGGCRTARVSYRGYDKRVTQTTTSLVLDANCRIRGVYRRITNGDIVDALRKQTGRTIQAARVGALTRQVYAHHFKIGDWVALRESENVADVPSLQHNHPYRVTRLVNDDLGPCIALEGIDGHWFYERRFRELPDAVIDLVVLEKLTNNNHTITMNGAGVTVSWIGPDGNRIVANGQTSTDAVKAFMKAVSEKPAPVDPYAAHRERAKRVLAGVKEV